MDRKLLARNLSEIDMGVVVQIIDNTFDLSSSFKCIANTTKLGANSCISKFVGFLLPVSDVEIIEEIAFFSSQFFIKGTVRMEVENIL